MYNLNDEEDTRVRIEFRPERVGTLDGTISLPTEVFVKEAQTVLTESNLFVCVMPR